MNTTTELETATQRVTIPVTGMTCASCTAHVGGALQRHPGVTDANVNLMTSQATVSFDPAAASPDQLVEAIRQTGYGAELPSTDEATADDEQAAQDRAHRDEFVGLRRKAVVSVVAGAVAMVA